MHETREDAMSQSAIELAKQCISESDLEGLRAHAEGAARARDAEGESLIGLIALAITRNVSIPLQRGTAEQRRMLDVALAAGADPSAANGRGWTPLHSAAMSGDAELVAALLAAGADPLRCENQVEGGIPVQFALFYGHTAAASALVDARPGPLNLRTAASLSGIEAIEACFDSTGAMLPVAWQGREFYRPLPAFPVWTPTFEPQETLDEALSWASRHAALDTMAILVERGARVNANPYRGTPLLWATARSRYSAMRWLVAHGADPSLAHDFGGANHGNMATALHLAAQWNDAEAVRVLLELGADCALADGTFHATPLGWAKYFGNTDIVRLLSVPPAHG